MTRTLFCLLLLAIAPLAQGEGVRYVLEIEGPEPYRTLIDNHIDLARWKDNPLLDEPQLQRLAEKTPDEIKRLLETEGYYSAKVSPSLTQKEGVWHAHFKVELGERVHVEKTDIAFTGAINEHPGEPSPATLRGNWGLKSGAPFRHADWEAAKHALLRDLTAKRYLGARITSSRAAVDPATQRADLAVGVDSGPVVRLGGTQVEGLQRYPKVIVDNLNPLHPGEEYDIDELLKFQARLQDSGYFAIAGVTAEPDPNDPALAPVTVRVEENKQQSLGFGVGYSTNTGARGQIDYQHNNLLGRGWRWLSTLKVETKAQSMQSDLYLPIDAQGRRNSVGAKAERTDLQGVVSRTYSLYAKQARLRGDIETQTSLGYVFEHKDVAGSESEINRALAPNFSWTVRRVQPPLYPDRGYQLNWQLGGASRVLASTQDFVRAYLKAIALFPAGEHGTVTVRGESGLVFARSRKGIPSDFLFRTGGDTTVRGYAYQSLGVPQGDATVGGRVLAVGSAEYTYWFKPQWGAAVFTDVGDAADSRATFKLAKGYGVGARWKSPIGPVNADVAYGERKHAVRLHFSIGLAF